MKLCKYCNKYYPESDFGVALTTKNKVYRRLKCRHCYRIAKQKLREKYRQMLIDYKEKRKCSKCGISDYRVLEFHHLRDKTIEIANASSNNHYGEKRLKKELSKCIVLCANCHRILHYNKRRKRKRAVV